MHVHTYPMEVHVPKPVQLQQGAKAAISFRPYARQGCLVRVNQHGDVIVSWDSTRCTCECPAASPGVQEMLDAICGLRHALCLPGAAQPS